MSHRPGQSLVGEQRDICLAILACVRQLDGRYGRNKILKLLKGSKAKGIPDWPSSFGILAAVPLTDLESFLQGLLDGGYLAIVGSEYPLLGLGAQGGPALQEQRPIEIVMPELPVESAKQARILAGL